MKAYFDSIEKEVPEALREVFLDRHDTAVITIDMHDGHLSTDPDCPCPSPRGREIIEPLNHFMDEARALGLPVIHVRSTLRRDGADEKLFPSAWRMVFPVTVGEIPNIAEHALEVGGVERAQALFRRHHVILVVYVDGHSVPARALEGVLCDVGDFADRNRKHHAPRRREQLFIRAVPAKRRDRKSTRLNSSHREKSRMPSSA